MGNEIKNSSNSKMYLFLFFGFIGVLVIILIAVLLSKKNTPPTNTSIPDCLSTQSCKDNTVCKCPVFTTCDSDTNSCKTSTTNLPDCTGPNYDCSNNSCKCSVGMCGTGGQCSSTHPQGCTGNYDCSNNYCTCPNGGTCNDRGQCVPPGCTGATQNCTDGSCTCQKGWNCNPKTKKCEYDQQPIVLSNNYSTCNMKITDPLALTKTKGTDNSGQDVMGCWTVNDLNDNFPGCNLKDIRSCAVGTIQLPDNIKATAYNNYGKSVYFTNMCSSGNKLGDYDSGSYTLFPSGDWATIPCGFKFEEVTPSV